MLLRRVLTALVGAPAVLAAVWFGPPWLTLLAAAAAAIAVRETYRLLPPARSPADADAAAVPPDGLPTGLPALLGGTWAVALVLAGALAGSPSDFGLAALAICAAGAIAAMLWMIAAWHGRRPAIAALYLIAAPVYVGGALACAVALRGIDGPYITLPAATPGETQSQWVLPEIDSDDVEESLVPLPLPPPDDAAPDGASVWILPAVAGDGLARHVARFANDGRWWLLLGILTVYASDTAAYAVGRLIGRHQMTPVVSPGKTWEGTAGGLAAALIATVLLGVLFPLQLQIWQLVGIGVILGSVSPLGDLLESKVKRLANVKDSGNLFPGHGGMLDRLDSLLPSLTVVYILAATAAATS